MKRPLITIVIPVHNEEDNVPHIYTALEQVFVALPTYNHEYLFVDDGSSDRSVEAIHALCAQHKHVKAKEFTRNFGKELATSAGLCAAKGDAVIMIDADLQHPPSLIPEFIAQWEEGAEVVVGVRTANRGEGLIKRYGSRLYYRIMRMISETDFVPGETDFRLMDRKVVDAFNKMNEHSRMTRSLINWLGFRKVLVPFEAAERQYGDAAYSTIKLMRLALHSFLANSLAPLRFAGYLGITITLLSLPLGLVVFINRYVFGDALGWHVSGPAQLAILNVFLTGVTLSSLGIIALYIGKISDEVSNRPLYVVRDRKNFDA